MTIELYYPPWLRVYLLRPPRRDHPDATALTVIPRYQSSMKQQKKKKKVCDETPNFKKNVHNGLAVKSLV